MAVTVSQSRRVAKRLFRWCLVNDRFEEGRARGVIVRVLTARRRGYLTVLSEFKRLVAIESAKHTATIDSAVPLPSELRTRIGEGLERAYGPGIQSKFVQDPELIGGIRIRVSSDVYDGTVRSRLTALASSFGIRSA